MTDRNSSGGEPTDENPAGNNPAGKKPAGRKSTGKKPTGKKSRDAGQPRKAEQRDAERQEAEQQDTERRDAERRDAERQEVEQRRSGSRKPKAKKPVARAPEPRESEADAEADVEAGAGKRGRPRIGRGGLGQRNGAEGKAGTPASGSLTRRGLLGTAGAVGVGGLALGAAGGAYARAATEEEPPAPLTSLGSESVPFHGKHQPGIVTPQQAHGHLIAFDLAAGAGRRQAAALLRRWSDTARRLMAGERLPGGQETDVARDAGPSSLTVTFGFGRGFFSRTGLENQLPDELAPLPDFSADALDTKRSDGDLWIQIGADDALVAFNALRALQRAAGDPKETVRPRWQMTGFNRSPGATAKPMTVRNLMGQIDGTNNPQPDESDFERRIFVPSSGSPDWMRGGSYAVVRRIRMLLDDWESQPLSEQEKVMGRRKSDGAPLTGGGEHTDPDLEKSTADGSPVIAADAHIRVASPDTNGGAAMLRRPFSYHDGFRDDGAPDAGLLFIAWQADPLRGFIPVQRKLDSGDALSRFIRHEASALFAVPGGATEGEYVGQRLLEG